MTKESYISQFTSLPEKSIRKTLQLFTEKATVPFIARYRKEMTGNLDEVQIFEIQTHSNAYEEIVKRKEYVLGVLSEKGVDDSKLMNEIRKTYDLARLEDLYLPYKSKRKTKADVARSAGLEPLAKMIMKQELTAITRTAERFESDVFPSPEDAIDGALTIIAEWMNENTIVRDRLRNAFIEHGVITSKKVKTKEDEGEKYRDFYEFSRRLSNCPSHRLLGLLRGTEEGILRMKIEPNQEYFLNWMERFFVKSSGQVADLIRKAIKDAYKRLLQPAMETETKNHYKALADDQSIQTFSKNLEKLLLAAPVGAKRVLAIDPGFKSGCKVVCLDAAGNLVHNTTIFPHPPQKDKSKASAKIAQLVQAYKVEIIAIGDGTAGRETETFIKHIRFDRDLQVYVVREDGASIYSASKIGREEFPEYDVTVRGAISIGRRLIDPLAELVKIDPKSLGVGQYQHDVNQTKLQSQLDQVILSSVNKVGVNLNTASKYLLSHVAGVGPKLAENIVIYRTEKGAFKNRKELMEVPRLGKNVFEQCAGFLRIKKGENPLDDSAVHPEQYGFVKQLLKKTGSELEEVIGKKEKVDQLRAYLKENGSDEIGNYTQEDILKELEKPGIDPRRKAKILEFDSSIRTINDLKIGQKINGIVTNVTDFGAFVNIGIKENGLIHITQLSDQRVNHPTDVISLHDHVSATVISVDSDRKRIGLSLKES